MRAVEEVEQDSAKLQISVALQTQSQCVIPEAAMLTLPQRLRSQTCRASPCAWFYLIFRACVDLVGRVPHFIVNGRVREHFSTFSCIGLS